MNKLANITTTITTAIIIIIIVSCVTMTTTQLVYHLQEEVEEGHMIGDVRKDAHLEEQYPREVLEKLSFNFLSDPGLPWLALHAETGVLFTRSRVDRESLCRPSLNPRQPARQRHFYSRPRGFSGLRRQTKRDAKAYVEKIKVKRYKNDSIVGSLSSGFYHSDHSSFKQNVTLQPVSLSNQCSLNVDIALSPFEHFSLIRCQIIITDINDNSPTFPNDHITQELPESLPAGNGFSFLMAKDLDDDRNSVVGYLLQVDDPTDHKFELKVIEKMDGSMEMKVELTSELNTEFKANHFLKVVAYDGGLPSKSGTLEIAIVVLDVNDNAPIFEKSLYESELLENAAIGSLVTRVLALDVDSGLNGEVTYSWAHSTASIYGGLFDINAKSGDIRVAGEVDHERTPTCHLIATATDNGATRLQAEVPVKVTVRDQNDNAPSIIINTLSQTSALSANVTEGFSAGTFVGHVKGNDVDSGKNGKFDCHLEGADRVYKEGQTQALRAAGGSKQYFRLKRMFSKEYNVITALTIDREALADDVGNGDVFFKLLLVCTDHGTPALTSQKQLLVYVNDVNDNQPITSQSSYHFKVPENQPLTQVIGVVMATDADAGDNARISYSLNSVQYHYHNSQKDETRSRQSNSNGVPQHNATLHVSSNKQGSLKANKNLQLQHKQQQLKQQQQHKQQPPEEGLLRIDVGSGEIRAVTQLDRERFEAYRIQVLVTDNGSPAMTATAWVELEVLDVNDNAPLFTASAYHFRLSENTEGVVEVGWVWASDADGSPYNQFNFAIVDCDGRKRDELQEKKIVEYSEEGEWVDEDASGDGEDAFDYKIKSASRKQSFSSRRTYLWSNGTGMKHVKGIHERRDRYREAHRSRQGRGGKETSECPFSIDHRQGVISCHQPLDREASSQHKLVVKATDMHDFTLTSTSVVMVAVDDENDNAPSFVRPSTAVATVVKQEPLLSGQTIAILSASDADHAANAEVTYLIVAVREKMAALNGGQLGGRSGNGSSDGSEEDLNSFFSIDGKSGRLVSNRDLYVNSSSLSSGSLRNRSLVVEVMAVDSGKERSLNSSLRLRIVLVKQSSASHTNAWFSLSEKSLAWTLVTCLSTFLVVVVLLTAIALLACQREATVKGSPVFVKTSMVDHGEGGEDEVVYCCGGASSRGGKRSGKG